MKTEAMLHDVIRRRTHQKCHGAERLSRSVTLVFADHKVACVWQKRPTSQPLRPSKAKRSSALVLVLAIALRSSQAAIGRRRGALQWFRQKSYRLVDNSWRRLGTGPLSSHCRENWSRR